MIDKPTDPAKPDDETSSDHPIGSTITSFAREVDALGGTLPLAMLVIREVNKTVAKDLREYEEQNCEVTVSGNTRTVSFDEETQHQFHKLFRRFERATRAATLVPRSFVVSLVSQFDSYLGALLRQLFLLQPKRLHAS